MEATITRFNSSSERCLRNHFVQVDSCICIKDRRQGKHFQLYQSLETYTWFLKSFRKRLSKKTFGESKIKFVWERSVWLTTELLQKWFINQTYPGKMCQQLCLHRTEELWSVGAVLFRRLRGWFKHSKHLLCAMLTPKSISNVRLRSNKNVRPNPFCKTSIYEIIVSLKGASDLWSRKSRWKTYNALPSSTHLPSELCLWNS